MRQMLSIIVPVLNEAGIIRRQLEQLAGFRDAGAEVIVVDGGSRDDSREIARDLADEVLVSPRGRASQMNAGARHAKGDALLFLHADTMLPDNADLLVWDALAATGRVWGRFDVRIASEDFRLAVIGSMMNLRSRVSGIATGDQAIFVLRRAFREVGGFPEIPLMEDIVFSKSLKSLSPPVCLQEQVLTSGRRWEQNGVARTVLLMWYLRLAFFLGAAPEALARQYGYVARRL